MILTWTVLLPLFGAILLAVVGALSMNVADRRLRDNALKIAALVVSMATFALSLHFVVNFDVKPDLEAAYDWFPAIGASFHLKLDGITLWLFLLTTFLTPICILASWRSITIHDERGSHGHDPHSAVSVHDEGRGGERGVGGFLICLLILETAMLGTFAAFDLLVFFVFWELMLIPMYFLIGIWGSPGVRHSWLFGDIQERVYATVKFVLYTMVGSALMLVGIIYLRMTVGTFNLDDVMRYAAETGFTRSAQFWLFWAFFLAFAIKVPLFPFHTWLPDAHVQAPTAGSVILAGVLLKMGTYGIIRFCLPLFPDAATFYAPFVSTLAVVGIIYGALVAMVQPDMKKLVAYSSVSHLGFVVLGLFSGTDTAIQGAILQMVNHGISTGALFLLVGMVYERRHTRLISEFGGIAAKMPIYAAFFLIVTFSSIGLPGTNGFVGEFLILLGTFMTEGRMWFAVFAATGVILAAVYMLWMVQRVFFGKIVRSENEHLHDLSPREVVVLLPLTVFIFVIGIFPKPFLDPMNDGNAVTQLKKAGAARAVVLSPKPDEPVETPPASEEHAPASPNTQELPHAPAETSPTGGTH